MFTERPTCRRAAYPGNAQLNANPEVYDRNKGHLWPLLPQPRDDPAEARFYQQMQLEPQRINGPHAVLIAPPGVLVGQFDSRSTADQIAASIHKAGQCCDDPNCTHGQAPQATHPTTNRQ